MAPAGPPPTMQHEVRSMSRISSSWLTELAVKEGVFIGDVAVSVVPENGYLFGGLRYDVAATPRRQQHSSLASEGTVMARTSAAFQSAKPLSTRHSFRGHTKHQPLASTTVPDVLYIVAR